MHLGADTIDEADAARVDTVDYPNDTLNLGVVGVKVVVIDVEPMNGLNLSYSKQ